MAGGLPVLGIVDDPALAIAVSNIITHPASAERPFLKHFVLARGGPGTPGFRSDQGRGGRPPLWLWLLLVEAGGLGATVVAIRRQPDRGHSGRYGPSIATRLRSAAARGQELARRGAVLGLVVPVALFVAAGVSAAGGVLRSAAVHPIPPRTEGLTATTHGPRPATTGAGAAVWTQLVSIEQRLDFQHQALVAQETTVADLTHRLQATGSPSPLPSPAAVDLAKIVELHQATLLAYQQTLDHEYQVFAAAAGDPKAGADLLTTAAAAGPAGAPAAIAFNLSAVQAQLAQDNAIGAAEAQAQAQELAKPHSSSVTATGRPELSPPLGGALTLGFGPTDLPFEAPATHAGVFYPHFHTGLDISGPFDAPVHAAADGEVILTAASVDGQGHLVGYGNYVAISHAGGLTTVYAHLDSISVKSGQLVHKGDVIGLEGSTGNSTGPHLHFETRISGGIVDPAPYLAGQIKRP